jgi:hypothetical protein
VLFEWANESSFSEEKEAKRLLFLVLARLCVQVLHVSLSCIGDKSLFASFSSEKEESLPS